VVGYLPFDASSFELYVLFKIILRAFNLLMTRLELVKGDITQQQRLYDILPFLFFWQRLIGYPGGIDSS